MTQFTPEPEDPMVYPYRSPEERAVEAQPSEAVAGEPEPTPSQPPADAESAPGRREAAELQRRVGRPSGSEAKGLESSSKDDKRGS